MATGVDGIPVLVLKLAAPVIASPIAHLIALSIKHRKVPKTFKSSIVVPIYKGKGKPINSPSSYRPVAILPALSKVLEKVILQQLTPFLEKKLPPCQFGFRPGRSATAAVATAHGAWAKASSAGRVTGIAAFDLTAAFDTVDHKILCQKLMALGITGPALAWFRDYMAGRTQRVRYTNALSPPVEVHYGVPQGSLLGPVLFLVTLSDFPKGVNIDPTPSPEGGTVGYADDVVLWIEGPSVEEVKPILEAKARAVMNYMESNYLALNPDKTQILWVGTGTNCPDVAVGDINVASGNNIELLGLKFNRHLKSNPHLEALTASAASIAGMARRLYTHLPTDCAIKVTRSLLTGKVGYGAATTLPLRLHDNDPQSGRLAKLQARINDAARAAQGIRHSSTFPITDFLKNTGLPSINRLAVTAVAVEAWKSLGPYSIGSDNPLSKLFGPLVHSCTRAGNTGKRKPATKLPVDSFVERATHIWNNNENLRNAVTLGAAKKVAISIAAAIPI